MIISAIVHPRNALKTKGPCDSGAGVIFRSMDGKEIRAGGAASDSKELRNLLLEILLRVKRDYEIEKTGHIFIAVKGQEDVLSTVRSVFKIPNKRVVPSDLPFGYNYKELVLASHSIAEVQKVRKGSMNFRTINIEKENSTRP